MNIKINTIKYIVIGALFVTLPSCDFLDRDIAENYDKEDIFSSYKRTKKMVTNIYGYLSKGFCNIDGAMHDAATDDAVHVYDNSGIQRFVNGTWSPNYLINDIWNDRYKAIRACNLYLAETQKLDFKEWENSDGYEDIMMEFNNTQWEVRFLRAYFYFELMCRYKNLPLVTTVLSEEEANSVEISSFSIIGEFIKEECKECASKLPVNYSGFASKEIGRVTKAAALALRARVSLYLASPLFNPSGDTDLYKEAAKAAYEIISNENELGLKRDVYSNLFSEYNWTSTEIIMARPGGASGGFEKYNFPIGVEGGKTSTCPSQNLVDAYEMKNGTPFDWNNPEHAANPYANRDPRLGMTIVYNGMFWPTSDNVVELWHGGKNAQPMENASKTGYYLKKYVNNSISFVTGSTVSAKHHNWVLFRLGEVYLNYAESMMGAFNDPNYKDAELSMTARVAANRTRSRQGVQMVSFPSSISSQEFNQRLRNERRVELAFEGHRFWDIRRWKILESTNEIYKVKVEKQENGSMKYTKDLLLKNNIDSKMYFYPISNVELSNNPNLIQNKGW